MRQHGAGPLRHFQRRHPHVIHAHRKRLRTFREEPPISVLDKQVGGDHYKNLAIQPITYCERNGLSACESSIVKYITRWRLKGGIEDLEKIKHYCDILIEEERSPDRNRQSRELGDIDDPRLQSYMNQTGCEEGTCDI